MRITIYEEQECSQCGESLPKGGRVIEYYDDLWCDDCWEEKENEEPEWLADK